MDENFTPRINYEMLVESALRGVVQAALKTIADDDMHENVHFYITFSTSHPDAVIPQHLCDKNSDLLAIVLQHQFWNLEIDEDSFSVELSFSGKKETLSIPYMSIVEFKDQNAGFELQFSLLYEASDDEEEEIADDPKNSQEDTPSRDEPQAKPTKGDENEAAKVVSLDAFRKGK